jgi:hypothetical protein
MRHVARLRENFACKLNVPDLIHNPTEAHLNHQSSFPEAFEKGHFPMLMVS